MGGFGGQNRGRGNAILTPNELVLTFRGSYVCANFAIAMGQIIIIIIAMLHKSFHTASILPTTDSMFSRSLVVISFRFSFHLVYGILGIIYESHLKHLPVILHRN